MIKNILAFELQYRFRKITTYIYFLIFFFIGFMAIYRGSVGHGFLTRLTGAGIGQVNANAPYAIYYLITFLSNYGIIITAALFGGAAHRDFKQETYGLYFSYPVKKIDYLAGRFAGAYIITLFVFSGAGLGALLTSLSPLANPDKLGSLNLLAYLYPYLTTVIPNIFFTGALFFTLVLITRNSLSVYIGFVFLILCYLTSASLSPNLAFKSITPLFEPLGHLAAKSFYNYWPAAQKNINLIPLSGILLFNRLIWVIIGSGILAFVYRKFQFSYIVESKVDHIQKELPQNMQTVGRKIFDVNCNQQFTFHNHFRQMVHSILYEFKELVQNKYFRIILLLGAALLLLMGFKNVGLIGGIQTYPVTSQVLSATQLTMYLFSIVVILFCSGELIWKERNKKVQEIYDALPMPDWVPFLGKLGALMLINIVILLIVMLTGMIVQIVNNYYHFDFILYFKELFGIRLIYYFLISIFSLFMQVIINKKFLGYIITVLFIDDFIVGFGLEHHLWTFATTPVYIYSDMNGYGPYIKSILFFNLYWICLAILLVVLSIFFFIRGNDTDIKTRFQLLKNRVTKAKLAIVGAGLLCSIIMGTFIIYNTTVLNKFESSKYIEKMQVAYEKNCKKFENMPQPRIMDIKLEVDIYPIQRKVYSNGRLIVSNKTTENISDIFVKIPDLANGELRKMILSVPYTLQVTRKEFGVYIYKLDSHIEPGDSIILEFDMVLAEQGFKNNEINTRLVRNGTFLVESFVIPQIGYLSGYELENNDKRKKYGLPPKGRVPLISNKKARMNNYISSDADWINFEAVVSTSEEQIALTVGELVNEWSEENRNYFHYKTTAPILKFFPFVSANYCVEKSQWKDVAIEVFYHEGHEYNIDKMIKSVKASLEYFTENFSPYQFQQIRVVEFPRYQTFAQSFPTIIPFSEGIGFISRSDKKHIDYFFKIAAHEVAHQWWAHQVIGANVQGLTLMSEVLSQYSALMVVKNEYDKAKVTRYVRRELEVYLRGRARERWKEMPLYLVENQPYIHYGKGFVVMNALQDYIGEDNLNTALRQYIGKIAFQEPPYTTSLEFLEYIREATPDSLQYIITDMFETITLYDNRMISATYEEQDDGKYLVKFKFATNKIRADEIGNEKLIDTNDYITFGVFGEDDEELSIKKHYVDSKIQELQIVVDKIPQKAAIDPYFYLIDKNTDDNFVTVEKETSKVKC